MGEAMTGWAGVRFPGQDRIEGMTSRQLLAVIIACLTFFIVLAIITGEPGVLLLPVLAWFAPRILRGRK